MNLKLISILVLNAMLTVACGSSDRPEHAGTSGVSGEEGLSLVGLMLAEPYLEITVERSGGYPPPAGYPNGSRARAVYDQTLGQLRVERVTYIAGATTPRSDCRNTLSLSAAGQLRERLARLALVREETSIIDAGVGTLRLASRSMAVEFRLPSSDGADGLVVVNGHEIGQLLSALCP